MLARPRIKSGFLGLFGDQNDAIDYYTDRLSFIDNAVEYGRKIVSQTFDNFSTAFVTLDRPSSAVSIRGVVLP